MPQTRSNPLHLAAAFASGCLLTSMVHFNGMLAHFGNALFSSWTAHGTGTLAALVYLAILYRKPAANAVKKPKAPLWAYFGGVIGAAIVMLTSTTVNSPLALSGTIALGLAGQVIFSLAADIRGLFGMQKRRPEARDLCAIALILGGSALIILVGESHMILWIVMAFAGGVFVSLSRQINGRLSLSNSPLIASFWNHIVGFVTLTLLGLVIGGLVPAGAADAPWYAYIGGPIGVIFIASGSWLIPRLGAVNTALLVIAGQMISGVTLDFFSKQPPQVWATALGVSMILGGMVLTQRRN